MKNKFVLAFISMILLFGLGCVKDDQAEEDSDRVSDDTQHTRDYVRQELDRFNGFIFGPGQLSQNVEDGTDKMKEWGVNIVSIRPFYCVHNDGSIELSLGHPVPPFMDLEQEFIGQIRAAHNAGIAVMLEPNTMIPGHDCQSLEISNKDQFIESFVEESVRWAEIAEQEQVELFSPLNEPDILLGEEKAFEWAHIVLPKLKEVYSGDIVLKLADNNNPGDYSGYDYVAFDIFTEDINKWSEKVNDTTKEMNSYVEEYNLKGSFFGEVGAATQADPMAPQLVAGSVVSEEVQAEYFEILFEESWDDVDGYFIVFWSDYTEEAYLIKKPAEEVIKDRYSRTHD